MAGIQMGGLASGLDTTTLISKLMSVERIPRLGIERQQAAAQTRQDALRDIVTKLKTLKQSATDLQSAALWTKKQTVTSADPVKVGVKTTSTVATGTYDVEVSQLATVANRELTYAALAAASRITITDSTGKSFLVDVAANATVDDVIAAINANGSLPVTARNYNGNLLLGARASGAVGNFTVTGSTITGQVASVAGVDTLFTVNGAKYASSTRTDAKAIAGAELSFASVTAAGSPVRITAAEPAADKDAVAEKLRKLVESYNAVVDTIRGKLTEKRVPNAQTMTDAKKGVLFGDPGLTQTLSSLRRGLMDPLQVGNASTMDELAEIGISTGAASSMTAEKTNGRLVFDEAKFKAAWDGDKASVERLLRGDGTLGGFAQRLDALIKPLSDAGGLYDGRITAAAGELTRLKDGLARMDLRLERKELFYRRQFTALETALAKMQNQGQELAARLGTSNGS